MARLVIAPLPLLPQSVLECFPRILILPFLRRGRLGFSHCATTGPRQNLRLPEGLRVVGMEQQPGDALSCSLMEDSGPQKRQRVAAEDTVEARRKREARMAEVRRKTRSEWLRMESLRSIISGVWSGNSTSQREATKQFQECFLTKGSPSIEEVIKVATVWRFSEFLQKEDSPDLQVEAAWALTSFISNTLESATNMLPLEAVHASVKLLGSPNDDVREQAIWALGNIAWRSPAGRDLILTHGVLSQLFAQLDEDSKLSMKRTASWALTNFRRGDPPPRFEQVRSAFPALDWLFQSNDEEVLTDACWAFYNLIHGFPDKIGAIVDLGICH
ncbi:hypothetical protein CRG98_038925 [Punica granatum]|uniref:IBB domain-containing protein n=1 Tax=Punica granatum TaxID=22663 RepID=A0A2I0IAH5_PUNGR|nr:hypothetical protein CRG98_038925 [Punica granatum]